MKKLEKDQNRMGYILDVSDYMPENELALLYYGNDNVEVEARINIVEVKGNYLELNKFINFHIGSEKQWYITKEAADLIFKK